VYYYTTCDRQKSSGSFVSNTRLIYKENLHKE
jgi:hypothetical protein